MRLPRANSPTRHGPLPSSRCSFAWLLWPAQSDYRSPELARAVATLGRDQNANMLRTGQVRRTYGSQAGGDGCYLTPAAAGSG